MDEFSPYETFWRAYQRLWVVIGLAFAGGLAGWGFHFFQPAVYEAKATLIVTIDFEQTGPLTDYALDYAVNAAGALMYSEAVLTQVVERGSALGVSQTELVYGRDLFRERKQETWELRVRNRNPQVAAELANVWAQASFAAIDESHQHALAARFMQNYLLWIEHCPPPPEAHPPLLDLCAEDTMEEAQARLEQVLARVNQEKVLSNGMNPALKYALGEPAEADGLPAAYAANWLVLAGTLIGFVLGVVLAALPQPRPGSKKP